MDPHLYNAALLGTGPAVFMLIFSVVGLGCTPPKALSGALQHFAAGILLSAVAQELVPPMVAAEGLEQNVAVIVGFSLGVLVMLLLGILLPEPEELPESKQSEEAIKRKQSKTAVAEICRRRTDSCSVSEQQEPLLGVSIVPQGSLPFPTAFLMAVVIDGCMDGLLLGIASAASESAGTVLAISLAIEMSFLGLTLATSLRGQPSSKALPAVLMSPIAIILAAAVGGYFAGLLASAEAFRIGLLSFGASALLFMVAEELLLEAHADGGEHVWWVDMQLYVGFLSSIYLSKLMG
ncbi:unnamed protein product [Polarella glacialis]|uniref:Uncharacterized protein n=2 Tax=Polarella glacialis TaxID=89957 RepID=A0A813G3Y4_POLGL|nr:unnamed protein product [Polarella glacialis]